MMVREMEGEFLDWLKRELSQMRQDSSEKSGPAGLRVSLMREAEGVDYTRSEAQTVAVQWEFNDISHARDWARGSFAVLKEACERRFGIQRVMVFTSIFEVWI